MTFTSGNKTETIISVDNQNDNAFPSVNYVENVKRLVKIQARWKHTAEPFLNIKKCDISQAPHTSGTTTTA